MEEERFLAGRKKAMALLLHKDRTRWELCDRLVRAGFEDDVVEDAIAYVESFHYIDDRRYAVRFAEIYCESRSIKRIRQDLMKRHVPEEYIEVLYDEIITATCINPSAIYLTYSYIKYKIILLCFLQ